MPSLARKPRRRWLIPLGTGVAGLVVGAALTASGSTAPTATPQPAASTTTATVTSTAPADRATAPTVTQTITVKPTITRTVRVTPAPSVAFSDGVYLVGEDIRPGRYRTTASVSSGCYWEIGKVGSDDIIQNDNPAGGRPTVILKTGEQFTSQDCGGWTRS